MVAAGRRLDHGRRLRPPLRYPRTVAVNPQRQDLRGVVCLPAPAPAEKVHAEVGIAPGLRLFEEMGRGFVPLRRPAPGSLYGVVQLVRLGAWVGGLAPGKGDEVSVEALEEM